MKTKGTLHVGSPAWHMRALAVGESYYQQLNGRKIPTVQTILHTAAKRAGIKIETIAVAGVPVSEPENVVMLIQATRIE